jgi:hypothetical protein
MNTVNQEQTKTILKMGELIEELQSQLAAALDRIQELEKQIYGSR